MPGIGEALPPVRSTARRSGPWCYSRYSGGRGFPRGGAWSNLADLCAICASPSQCGRGLCRLGRYEALSDNAPANLRKTDIGCAQAPRACRQHPRCDQACRADCAMTFERVDFQAGLWRQCAMRVLFLRTHGCRAPRRLARRDAQRQRAHSRGHSREKRGTCRDAAPETPGT